MNWFPMWSECIRIGSYCLHGVRVYHHVLPMWLVCHHILYQFILFTWSECVTIYCPCGQSVSPCIAHVVSMYRHVLPMWLVCHHILYQFIRFTWSECVTIYCPCGQSVSSCVAYVVRVYRVRGQSVSPYAISIHIVCMVSMCYHILPTWSVCIAYAVSIHTVP
jgi:hypothetical protein